jgi:hypothetical protein
VFVCIYVPQNKQRRESCGKEVERKGEDGMLMG